MTIFNYEDLKEDINFPCFIEENIIKLDKDECYKQLIFEYDNKYYEVVAELELSKHDDYDYYFSTVCQGKVICQEVEKLEVNVQVWKSKQSMVELEEQLKKMRKSITKELSNMSIPELGNIIVQFGNKHKGKTVKQVYSEDKEFIVWTKNNPPVYNVFNKFVYEKEKSRLAMIIYMESIEYLNFQGA